MAGKSIAYVGSYTRGKSKGITVFDVDEYYNFKKRFTYEINNPSYLEMSHDQNFLYTSCDEGVAAFRILDNGGLTLLNKAPVNGLRPCYLSVDKKNRFLLSAGYHDGKMTVLRLKKDGSVGEVTDEVFMTGIALDGGHHYMCHVNCAIFSPDERFVFSVDTGLDQVKIYEFNHQRGKLKLHGILRCEINDGPKHMLFSNDGKFAYLTFENKNMVKQYSYDAENAKFTEIEALSTLPEGAGDHSNTVALKLTPDDKYLFVANSGNNSVAVFGIDETTKKLSRICVLPISGEYPRDLLLCDDKKTFACVNQFSDSITFFEMNYEKKCFTMQRKPASLYSPTTIQLKTLA